MLDPFFWASSFLIDLFFTFSLVTLVIYASLYYIMSFGALKRKKGILPPLLTDYPSVSIIIPMHNEELVVPTTMEALSLIDYPNLKAEIIIVEDRSTDNTPELLKKYVNNFPFKLKIIYREENQRMGKAAALNDGINASVGDVLVFFDADHKPDVNCVKLLAFKLVNSGPKVAAVQGVTHYLNENENICTKIVALNRDPGFAVYLEAGKCLFVAGSTLAIKREVLNKVGLFNENSVTEDTDLSVRLYLNGFKIVSESSAFSLEEAVNNFKAMRTRTYRWSRGHDRVLLDYWKKVLESKLPKASKIYLEFYLAYFLIPVVTFFSGILFLLSILLVFPMKAFFINWTTIPWLIFSIFYFLYCFLSIPTFYWVGIKLTGRRLRGIFVFLFDVLYAFVNIWVCTRAFFDELFKRKYLWVKTPRSETFYKNKKEN